MIKCSEKYSEVTLLDFLCKIKDYWKVVAEAVKPYASCGGALRVALVFSCLLEQIVAAENLMRDIFKGREVLFAVLVEKIGSHDNLVEEIP